MKNTLMNKKRLDTAYEGLVQKTESGENTISVLISGVHCAMCIQKVEGALKAEPNIKSVRLNLSTGRLNMSWAGEAANANDYVDRVERLGYSISPIDLNSLDDKDQKELQRLIISLGVAGFAMGNIMLISVGLWSADSAQMGQATRGLMHWVSALIAIPALIFSARPFYTSAFAAFKNKQSSMDIPITLAIFLAAGVSLYETATHGEHIYFDSAIMLTFFLLVGRFLALRTRRSARGAASDLLQSLSEFATIINKGKTKRVHVSELKEGMRVQVAAGEKIPIDGIVEKGFSQLDTSLITGETLPQDVEVGAAVYAGTINLTQSLMVVAQTPAEDSALVEVAKLMERAEQAQSHYMDLASRASKLYVPVVHSLAAVAFLFWWLVMGAAWQEALLIAVTVLIITCPCALGLAVPVAQVLSTSLLMQKGVLVKSGDALERLSQIDTVLFDKTGTLTLGDLQLRGDYKSEDLKLAASLGVHSQHPLSVAMTAAYDGRLLDLDSVSEAPGQGLEAVYKGRKIRMGKRSWCNGQPNTSALDVPSLWLEIEGSDPVCFVFEDQIKSDALLVLDDLRSQKIECVVLSGDQESAVKRTSTALKVDIVYAEQTPKDKHDVLTDMQKDGHTVLVVGDGLNDAPILALADVSMAPGTALSIAQNAADIVFTGTELSPIPYAYTVARKTQHIVKQNFALAVGYNVLAVPIAMAGLVTPMIAAIAMSGSSLLVIANSLRLRSKP